MALEFTAFKNAFFRKETMRIWRNLIFICLAFTANFTTFNGASVLQSSLNADEGLGTGTLSIIYASQILSAMFLPSYGEQLGCAVSVKLHRVLNFLLSWTRKSLNLNITKRKTFWSASPVPKFSHKLWSILAFTEYIVINMTWFILASYCREQDLEAATPENGGVIGHFPPALSVGATRTEVPFLKSIMVNLMVYHYRLETNLLQLFAHPETSEWYSMISVFIFEVDVIAEQKQAWLVNDFLVFAGFYCTHLLYPPLPCYCSGVPVQKSTLIWSIRFARFTFCCGFSSSITGRLSLSKWRMIQLG